MKFEQIINKNNVLLRLKALNKQLDYEITKILLINLSITNKLVNNQNVKLNNLVGKYAVLDGFDYVIADPEKKALYEEEYKAIFDEDVDIESMGFTYITERDLKGSSFDMETIELLSQLFASPNTQA